MSSNSTLTNFMSMEQLLEFQVAFANEKPLTPDRYLKGGNREVILKVAARFLSFKSFGSKFKDNIEFLQAIFGPDNNDFANKIYDKIRIIEGSGIKINITNPQSSLKLFEFFFEKGDQRDAQSHAEFERNMFKAYLVFNSEFTHNQRLSFSSTEELRGDLKIPMILFCMSYPVSDKTNYDINQIWTTQLIKATYLFQFLECNLKTKLLLDAFLAHFNCLSWQEYLKNLLPLTVSVIQNDREVQTDIVVKHDENFSKGCAFIERLIVQDSDELDQNDFLTLRARPFYKVRDGVYRVIFPLFVVEKIFKGAYFLLRDVNNILPSGQQIQGFKSI